MKGEIPMTKTVRKAKKVKFKYIGPGEPNPLHGVIEDGLDYFIEVTPRFTGPYRASSNWIEIKERKAKKAEDVDGVS